MTLKPPSLCTGPTHTRKMALGSQDIDRGSEGILWYDTLKVDLLTLFLLWFCPSYESAIGLGNGEFGGQVKALGSL